MADKSRVQTLSCKSCAALARIGQGYSPSRHYGNLNAKLVGGQVDIHSLLMGSYKKPCWAF